MVRQFRFRLNGQAHADILAMAEYVGKPGNLTAGLCGVFAEWRRLKAEREDLDAHDAHAQIAQQEAYLAAMDRRADAEGRGYGERRESPPSPAARGD